MDRKIILSVLAVAIFGFVGIMLLMPEERNDGVPRLPWLVTADPQGRTQAFGFTIGETSLAEIREVLGEEGKINLFLHADREAKYSVEAYFDHIYLNRLRGDFVITLDADQDTLDAMYQRGLRISQLGSGDKKITLTPEDIDILLKRPIRVITYLPWKSLDAEIVEKRFGRATEMLTEQTGVVHRLYPDKGMDVALDTSGGVVIQYVNPNAFEALIAPLKIRPNPAGPSNPTAEPAAAESDLGHRNNR